MPRRDSDIENPDVVDDDDDVLEQPPPQQPQQPPQPYPLPVKHAIIVITAHSSEIGQPLDSTGEAKQYPDNYQRCFDQHNQLLINSLFSNIELDNMYTYNIAPQGHQGWSGFNPNSITSRYMKSNLLDDLIKAFSEDIIRHINPLIQHDSTTMTYNKHILELFFSDYGKQFIEMFMAQNIALLEQGHTFTYANFMEEFKDRTHPSNLMVEHKTINSRLEFNKRPSNQITRKEMAQSNSSDLYSTIFLSFNENDPTNKRKYDITLVETWVIFRVKEVIEN